MDFLNSPLRCPEVNGVAYPMDKLNKLMAHTPGQISGHNLSYTITSPIQNNNVTPLREAK